MRARKGFGHVARLLLCGGRESGPAPKACQGKPKARLHRQRELRKDIGGWEAQNGRLLHERLGKRVRLGSLLQLQQRRGGQNRLNGPSPARTARGTRRKRRRAEAAAVSTQVNRQKFGRQRIPQPPGRRRAASRTTNESWPPSMAACSKRRDIVLKTRAPAPAASIRNSHATNNLIIYNRPRGARLAF